MSKLEAMARRRGVMVLYLAPYSLGYNPIEYAFSYIKAKARKESIAQNFQYDNIHDRVRRYASEITEATMVATFKKCFITHGLPLADLPDDEEDEMVAAILAFAYLHNDVFGLF